MSGITREELQHEIDVRVEERSEYEGSRQCRRTEELDEQLALYRLALIGLDAQEKLGACNGDLMELNGKLLVATRQLRTARFDALEEAAKVCDESSDDHRRIYNEIAAAQEEGAEVGMAIQGAAGSTAWTLAKLIRALKEST